MQSFKTYLTEEEKLGLATTATTTPLPSHRFLAVADRLAFGRSREDFAIAVLERVLGPVQRTNSGADTGRGSIGDVSGNFLDGVITPHHSGVPVSFQFKSRESGTDILVEVYKNLETNPPHPGRDMRTTAQLYIVLDPSRTMINIYDANKVKEAAKSLVTAWESSGQSFDSMRSRNPTFSGPQGMLKKQQGDTPGASKLIAYINPKTVSSSGLLPGMIPAKVMVPKDMLTPGGSTPQQSSPPTAVGR